MVFDLTFILLLAIMNIFINDKEIVHCYFSPVKCTVKTLVGKSSVVNYVELINSVISRLREVCLYTLQVKQ